MNDLLKTSLLTSVFLFSLDASATIADAVSDTEEGKNIQSKSQNKVYQYNQQQKTINILTADHQRLLDEQRIVLGNAADKAALKKALSEKLSAEEATVFGQNQESYMSRFLSYFNPCAKADRPSLESLLDQDHSLLQRLDAESVAESAALASLAYVQEGTTISAKTQNVTPFDAEIEALKTTIDELAGKQKRLKEISSTYGKNLKDNSKDKSAALAALKKELSDNFDIKIEGENFLSISQAIASKKVSLEKKSNELEDLRKITQNDMVATLQSQVQSSLNNNLHASGYEVVGVFFRNNGEFSGFAAKKDRKLVLSFAGSKSLSDWVGNALGWNGKISADKGYLQDLNFHYGFANHFNSISDSAFEFASRYLSEHKNDIDEVLGTGHSLGGAITSIFTAALKEKFNKLNAKLNVGLVTFGTPNFLHSGSVEGFRKIFGGANNIVHIVNSWDPVPKMAFWKDTPGLTVTHANKFLGDTTGGMKLFRNHHSMDDYYREVRSTWEGFETRFATAKSIAKENKERLATLEGIESKIAAKAKEIKEAEAKFDFFQARNIIDFAKHAEDEMARRKKKDESLRVHYQTAPAQNLTASIYYQNNQKGQTLLAKIKKNFEKYNLLKKKMPLWVLEAETERQKFEAEKLLQNDLLAQYKII